ncbi:MAG: FAD-binding oxidoreductase [Acidimicrobiales bacterium]
MSGPAPAGADEARWLAADRARSWEVAQVLAVVPTSPGAATLRLRLPSVPDLLPGQYYLVRLAMPSPPGAVEQAYSVSSAPDPTSAEIEITVREVEGGRTSPLLVRQVRAGDVLGVRGPFGFLTWTEADGGPLGLIGAGSGVAPLISIARQATAPGLTTQVTMLCSSRDRASLLLRRPMEELGRRPGVEIVHTFTRRTGDPAARYHRRIDAAMLAEVMAGGRGDAPARYYVAGPSAMVQSARTALGDLGVPDGDVVSEDHA